MKQYSDEDLINEIKHRGLKIEVPEIETKLIKCGKWAMCVNAKATKVLIGGVAFDIK